MRKYLKIIEYQRHLWISIDRELNLKAQCYTRYADQLVNLRDNMRWGVKGNVDLILKGGLWDV